jgi:hypothetical protein
MVAGVMMSNLASRPLSEPRFPFGLQATRSIHQSASFGAVGSSFFSWRTPVAHEMVGSVPAEDAEIRDRRFSG